MNKIFFGVPSDDLRLLCLNAECDEEVVSTRPNTAWTVASVKAGDSELVLRVPWSCDLLELPLDGCDQLS